MSKPTPKFPTRMSAPKIEDTKPSKLIAAFWWMVFIVPVIFVYWSTGSIAGVVILVGIRILLIFIPKFWQKAKPEPVESISPKMLSASQPSETVNTRAVLLSPYIDEAKSEWDGLMKVLRIYDKEKEEKNLTAYRKIRGWE